MDKRVFSLILACLLAPMAFAQAYRWVDENGVVHYSDRPQPGAEEVELPRANTTTVRRYPARDRAEDQPPPASQPLRYESIAVVSPVAEQTLWNIEGLLNVSISLSPSLQSGHRLRVYFDGTPREAPGLSFQLQEVWRGEHNLQAEVVNASGEVLIRSQPVRFYVQQSTVRVPGAAGSIR